MRQIKRSASFHGRSANQRIRRFRGYDVSQSIGISRSSNHHRMRQSTGWGHLKSGRASEDTAFLSRLAFHGRFANQRMRQRTGWGHLFFKSGRAFLHMFFVLATISRLVKFLRVVRETIRIKPVHFNGMKPVPRI